MNVKYYHNFLSVDGTSYRFEILTNNGTTTSEVEATNTPFSIEYAEIRKLTPVQGSQATLGLISKRNFEFTDLHTDNIQEYLVRFYKDDILFWIGWLDSELYSEQIANTPPYPVEYSAADFNILERLKYQDNNDKKYQGNTIMIEHLKRCFDKLALPFDKMFIGCSTTCPDIELLSNETVLHKLFVQSSNFYDEDGEPMTCREVVESILQPFALTMIQRDGSVFIFDLNTVKSGAQMKCYDFQSLSYIGDRLFNFNLGNVHEIGFASTSGNYGFEEMFNNVTITSSIYAENEIIEVKTNEENFSEEIDRYNGRDYNRVDYAKCNNIENISEKFRVYTRTGEENYEGATIAYTPSQASISPILRVRIPEYLIGTEGVYFINVKLFAFIKTQVNPYIEENIESDKSGVIKLHCNLYATDEAGTITRYVDLVNLDTGDSWEDTVNGVMPQGKCILWFSNEKIVNETVLDKWLSNCNIRNPMGVRRWDKITKTAVGVGVDIPTNQTSGYIIFEITDKCRIVNPKDDTETSTENLLEQDKVNEILLRDIEITIKDKDGNDINTDDYEFRSYINKKVASDFDEITLNIISANEDGIPSGKANILRKVDDKYYLQNLFTRAGQTDILERLLMCTIHSNFTTKNEKMSVDIKGALNPMVSYTNYQPILNGEYLVSGCRLDFAEGKTTLYLVGFSEDTAILSDIPYD